MKPNHLCIFERGHHGEHSCEFMKFGPVVQKMSFKEKVYGRRDVRTMDGKQTKTNHNSSP